MVLRLLGENLGENRGNPAISLDASDAMALAYHHFLIWRNQYKMDKINMDKINNEVKPPKEDLSGGGPVL